MKHKWLKAHIYCNEKKWVWLVRRNVSKDIFRHSLGDERDQVPVLVENRPLTVDFMLEPNNKASWKGAIDQMQSVGEQFKFACVVLFPQTPGLEGPCGAL